MVEILALVFGLLQATFRDRANLVAENLVLRQQLAVLARPTRRRPRLCAGDKVFWVLIRRLWHAWRRHVVLVRPSDGHRLASPGLAAVLALEVARSRRPAPAQWRGAGADRDHGAGQPRMGAERIRGELLKLGIAVSRRSVQRYRRRGPTRPPSQTWRTFLTNHLGQIWAADLFTVQTLTFKTLYVLLFITHDRRELVHLNVTAHPTAAWVWRQLIQATPWGRQLRYLLRDRDAVYGGDFVPRARCLGIATVVTPVRAPRANAIAERVIGTVRRECLDHVIILSERHLRTVLAEFVAFYNRERPHRTLRLQTPQPLVRPVAGPIRARPILGGLLHAYERAA